MAYCLIPALAEKFKKALKSGDINPRKLSEMTSKKRREFFDGLLGETHGKKVNALLETKLLLKNKERGMITWAKQLSGIKDETRVDLISKIERMIGTEENKKFILNPKNEEMFLQDLASTRLGVDVTIDEARKITKLSEKITKAKELHLKDVDNELNRIKYGRDIISMNEYVADLKPGMNAIDQFTNVANVPRALMATLDVSAPGRQGFGMITRKSFWKNLKPMFKALFSENAYADIQADIITRPNYDKMKKAGLRLSGLGDKLTEREEAFMTNLLDKIPGIRGSERAYTSFLSKLRADAFDDFVRKAELAGEDVSKQGRVIKDLADVVNNFTGAGRLGKIDQASPLANAFFFSPRKIAASVQKLNPQKYLDPRISPTARKEAFKSLVGMLGVSSSILALSNMAGADNKSDPRSSDFGKVKIGETRFDVSGGESGYLVLLARMISNKTKSTTSDIVRTLGEDYGASTRGDTLVKFFRNKLSPTASYVGDYLYGEDAIGKPFDAKKSAINRTIPLIIQTVVETQQEDPEMVTPSILAELFGVSASTYVNATDWNESKGVELLQFKEEVGQKDFDKANEKYNKEVKVKINKLLDTDEYQELSDDDKKTITRKIKSDIKSDIFKANKFKFKKTRAEKKEKKETDKKLKSLIESL